MFGPSIKLAIRKYLAYSLMAIVLAVYINVVCCDGLVNVVFTVR